MNGQVRWLSFAAIGGRPIAFNGKPYSGSTSPSADRSTFAWPTGPFESMMSIMIERRCLSHREIKTAFCFRTISSAWENGFVAHARPILTSERRKSVDPNTDGAVRLRRTGVSLRRSVDRGQRLSHKQCRILVRSAPLLPE